MTSFAIAYDAVRTRVNAACNAAGSADVALIAVSKTQSADAVRAMATQGQRSFGENYVAEALAKQAELKGLALQWHCIGPLQSNKCREVAGHFSWLQTLDRNKLITLLDRHRPAELPPLNVLIQVNIDDEASKSGCAPESIGELAESVVLTQRLRLRGLMAIPKPDPDLQVRRVAFARMRILFERLRSEHDHIDTLSMGMSEDFELAIAEGATMVRIGSALFGSR
jgi:PLP dependent protein